MTMTKSNHFSLESERLMKTRPKTELVQDLRLVHVQFLLQISDPHCFHLEIVDATI